MRVLGNYIFKLNVYTLFLKSAIYYKNCNTTKFNKKRQIEKVKEKQPVMSNILKPTVFASSKIKIELQEGYDKNLE